MVHINDSAWRQRERTLRPPELLRLARAPDTAVETCEGDDLLVLLDITEVLVRLGELQPYNTIV